MWSQTSIDPNTYLIGGFSNSNSLLETNSGVCNVNGCAFLAVWTSQSEKYWKRWVIKSVQSVVAMDSTGYGNNTSVVIYSGTQNSQTNFYIGFV